MSAARFEARHVAAHRRRRAPLRHRVDERGDPGSSRYTLINPRLAISGSFNTSSAWSNATLEKVKQYFVVVKTTSRSLQIGLRVNDKLPGQI